MMQIQIGKDETSWTAAAWTWVNQNVHPGARVFLPAGNTPRPLYRRWTEEPSPLLRSLRLVQIDDILTGPSRGTFCHFFKEELAPYLNQFEFINEADRGADYAILGVGLNGHVAFHEPGVRREFYSGCLPLSERTHQYLSLEPTTWGVTYGAAAFLNCRKILVLARGEQKRQVLRAAARDHSLPIGWILEHPDVTVVSDLEF